MLTIDRIVDNVFNELNVLATRVDNISDKRLLHITTARLKPNIPNEVKVLDPKYVESVHQNVTHSVILVTYWAMGHTFFSF